MFFLNSFYRPQFLLVKSDFLSPEQNGMASSTVTGSLIIEFTQAGFCATRRRTSTAVQFLVLQWFLEMVNRPSAPATLHRNM